MITLVVSKLSKQYTILAINALGGKAGRRVMRKATTASGGPATKTLRQLIPRRGPYGTGTLKRNIARKSVTNAEKGIYLSLTGARRKATGRIAAASGRKPSRYFHLVDKGAKAHINTNAFRGAKEGSFLFAGAGRLKINIHPGVKAQDYTKRALRQSAKACADAFVKKANEELKKELATMKKANG